MPQSVQPLPPQVAMMIDQKIEDDHKQLYRVVYISRVHPDDSDLNKVAMLRCVVHLFAFDGAEAYQVFSNNVPENYPVTLLVTVGPVEPEIPEDSMLTITRGPRAVQ